MIGAKSLDKSFMQRLLGEGAYDAPLPCLLLLSSGHHKQGASL